MSIATEENPAQHTHTQIRDKAAQSTSLHVSVLQIHLQEERLMVLEVIKVVKEVYL
jgi:hypothetical protein